MTRWGIGGDQSGLFLPEQDYTTTISGWDDGTPIYKAVTVPGTAATAPSGNAFSGNQGKFSETNMVAGSACFAMAIDLETSNGVEISGLNAEEQSDISLLAYFGAAQNATFTYTALVYYDYMIVLRQNNMMDLIQ